MSPGPIAALSYATAEKAWLYRPIMRLFGEAKSRFVLHLRPGDVAAELRTSHQHLQVDQIEVERALMQLCDWGNLLRHFDTAEVTTVEEFNRPRYLYQVSRHGEAAELALRTFEETVEQAGELQSAALVDIRDLLAELLDLAAPPHDASRVSKAWGTLLSRFDQLTARAQRFISDIQPAVQLQAVEMDTFFAYKRMLVDYLERFIHELVVRTGEIVGLLERLEAGGVDDLLRLAVEREFVDALAPSEEQRATARQRVLLRWQGLRGWFIADGEGRSQAEELRAHARRAIPALLRAVLAIHDRRLQRSDRVADLRTLARWFATAPDDRAAARLWRAAFALSPARHLRVTEETLDRWDQASPPPSTSWFDAPPMRLSPRLRRTGRHGRVGGPPAIIDRSVDKARLRASAEAQQRQLLDARRRLHTDGPIRLSQIGSLDLHAFDLFLELLGEALAARRRDDDVARALSIDGTMMLELVPIAGAGWMSIRTPWGWFRGLDHDVRIEFARRGTEPTTSARHAQSPGPLLLAQQAEAAP